MHSSYFSCTANNQYGILVKLLSRRIQNALITQIDIDNLQTPFWLNKPDKNYGETLLIIAVKNNHLQAVKLLIANDANIYYQVRHANNPRKGWNALDYATYLKYNEICDILREKMQQHAKAVDEIKTTTPQTVKKIASLEKQPENKYEESSLMSAVKNGHRLEVYQLISAKANVNEQIAEYGHCEKEPANLSGWSALHFAAYFGRCDIAQILLLQNADISLKSKKGLTAMDVGALYTVGMQGFFNRWLIEKRNNFIPTAPASINSSSMVPQPTYVVSTVTRYAQPVGQHNNPAAFRMQTNTVNQSSSINTNTASHTIPATGYESNRGYANYQP